MKNITISRTDPFMEGGVAGGVGGLVAGTILGPFTGPIASVVAGGVGGFNGDLIGQVVGNNLQGNKCKPINWKTPFINLFAGMLGPVVGNITEANLTATFSAEAAERSGANVLANTAGQAAIAPAQGYATYGGDAEEEYGD